MEKIILPYGPSRKRAGLTQEKASEILGISCRCLCDYETGVRPVPNQIVDLMVMAYDDRLLAVQHLRISAPSVNDILPEFRSGLPFGQTACRLFRLMNDFVDKNDMDATLMMIAEDGVVDSHQEDDYVQILAALHEITTASLEVEFSEKGRSQ
jgi:hypothetical protein